MSHEPTNGRQTEAVADSAVRGATRCRHCDAPLRLTVVDLGKSPLCQTVLTAEQTEQGEMFYPLHARACERCWLVQIPEFVPPEDIFTEYAYFSAYSDSWVEHSRRYVDAMTERLGLGRESLVVELASNDGYLLQHFLPKGIPVLGVEPAVNVAEAAVERGVESLTEFFTAELGRELAAERGHADLVLGNNVLAQVPDINDFVEGVAALLGPDGTATFEFPYLANLIERLEYDTIYHEHFSYFSLHSIRAIFGAQNSIWSMSKSCRRTAARFACSCSTASSVSSPLLPSTGSSSARRREACWTPSRTTGSPRAYRSRSVR